MKKIYIIGGLAIWFLVGAIIALFYALTAGGWEAPRPLTIKQRINVALILVCFPYVLFAID